MYQILLPEWSKKFSLTRKSSIVLVIFRNCHLAAHGKLLMQPISKTLNFWYPWSTENCPYCQMAISENNQINWRCPSHAQIFLTNLAPLCQIITLQKGSNKGNLLAIQSFQSKIKACFIKFNHKTTIPKFFYMPESFRTSFISALKRPNFVKFII